MKSLVKIAAFILVFAGAAALVHYAVLFLFRKDPGLLLHHGAGQVTFYALFILLVFVFQKYVNRQSFTSLGLKLCPGWRRTLLRGWAAGVLAFVGCTFLMDLFGVIDLRMKYGFVRLLLALAIGMSAFAIALTEEILFRGFFLQTLLKDLPKWFAVTVTGIIFVFFHKLGSIQDFWTVPFDAMLAGGLFSLNVLLCAAYFKSGSLFLPIGIHSGLVFAKVVFRKLKLIDVIQNDSYLFGLGGDARRGVLAWILFLAGILALKYLVVSREKNS